ncbi:hypothetical protein [Lysobacter sp. CA199]|uniref:hypothetical protein n=1 Tax=Lysobacter sp. CA199 TaxID=3455608 RepID=UPI003F8D6E26
MSWTIWHFALPALALLGVGLAIVGIRSASRVYATSMLARVRPLPRQRLALPGGVYCNAFTQGDDWDGARFVLYDAKGAELDQYGKPVRLLQNRRPVLPFTTSFIVPDDGVVELSIENAPSGTESDSWVVIQRDVELVVFFWGALGLAGVALALFGFLFAAMMWSSALMLGAAAAASG